ncbi:LPXTG cell wall surface protein [Streptococcus varani]|uniref:LPXTG cell wall surface protein n=2 Tax=Streptococcus varani TaxID=1608583 RepID=A0A0E4H3Q0_9STRE|nr:LPXTG cell wall surface protein [Streptococcus varani]
MKKTIRTISIAMLGTMLFSTASPVLANTSQTAINQAEAEVLTAQEAVRKAEDSVITATNNLASAEVRYDTAKSNLSKAQNDLSSYPIFTLTEEYINTLKSYKTSYDNALKSQLAGMADSLIALNQYTPNPNDNYVVDLNNLSNDHKLELSFFAQTVENQIRTQFGLPETLVTQSAINFSSDISRAYLDSRYPTYNKHYATAINSISKTWGLYSIDSEVNQFYESKSSYFNRYPITMSGLKHVIYDTYVGFLFPKDEWLHHALSVTGLYDNGSTSYLALSFSGYDNLLNVHKISVRSNLILPGSNFDTVAFQNQNTDELLVSKVSEAQTEFGSVQVIYKTRLTEKSTADATLSRAKAALAEAQKSLDDLKKEQGSSSSSSTNKQKPSSSASYVGATTVGKKDDSLLAVYRMYNPGLKVHLYTTDSIEYDILATRGWQQEGESWKTTKSGVPVYRMYNPGLKVHLYTKDVNEYQILSTHGWQKEGISYRSEGTVKIYRMYNPDLKKHLYTKDANEYKVLATRGWNQEGVAWNSK